MPSVTLFSYLSTRSVKLLSNRCRHSSENVAHADCQSLPQSGESVQFTEMYQVVPPETERKIQKSFSYKGISLVVFSPKDPF